MDNLGILVQAILSLKDTKASKDQIASELPKLESQLQSDKNTRIKIVAELDTDKSKAIIQSQLNTLATQAKAPAIKIGIDASCLNSVQGATQNITNSLKTVEKQASNTSNVVKEIGSTTISDNIFKKLLKDMDISNNQTDEYKANLRSLATELKTTWETGNQEKYKNALKNIIDLISEGQRITRRFTKDSRELLQAQELIANIQNGVLSNNGSKIKSKFYIPDDFRKELEFISGKKGTKSLLNSLYGVGNWSFNPESQTKGFKNLRNEIDACSQSYRRFEQSSLGGNNHATFLVESANAIQHLKDTIKSTETLNSSIIREFGVDKGNEQIEEMLSNILQLKQVTKDNVFEETDNNTSYIERENDALKEQVNITKKLKAIRESITRDANGQQISRTSVYGDTEFTRTSRYNEKDELTSYTDTENYDKLAKSLAKANVEATKLQARLDSVKSKYEDVNASKSIKDDSHLQQLGNQYNVVQQAIENVRTSDSNTMAQMKANADAEIKKLEDLTKQFRNAEYAANALRERDITTVKNTETNDLNKFIAQINSAKIPVQSIKSDIEGLKTALANVTDKESLTAYLNQFDVAKSKFDSIKVTYSSIENAIKSLNTLQNSTTFKNNASNPQVTKTKQEIAQLLAEYQNLKTQMQGNITPEGLVNIGNQLTQLNARFNDAATTAKRFETELKSDNGAEQLAQKVKLLNERIKAYQSANPKAAKAFSQEFSDMTKTLSSPNIDLSSYNSVAKQLQIIKVRANEANLAGKTMWATFKEKLAKFTGWMSMTAAVSTFTRSIRDALVELKEVDTVLTEISKANDKLTNSQLSQIASSSFGISSKYGKTATDYLIGVQEMSRAGYANAEAMGELSTAAQGAGDMTADVANQFIIAADKAYKMNGSVEELTKTLDGINYITNNNAVNMSELSEGFSIVSSTAAASGVSAKELTAALGTMAATTQQSGSEIARAFRAILLNIRQVSDEEEGIDAEGLTKYEKACNDLGVSLKEVKDGVLQLRDPMQVLKELSIEYNKLSETDLKRTNLLNSVGGKLRSTQLDALLRQWSMYEEMLQQYEAGSGSMAREANNYCLVA